jgi:hypothetical protein
VYNAAFIILRVLVGIAAFVSLAVTGAMIVVIGFVNLLKGGLGAIWAVIVVFASGFRKSPTVPGPDPAIPLPLLGLLIFFLAMFASAFLPAQKYFLHIVAAMAVIAGLWEAWRIAMVPQSQVLYLPVIGLWAVYYAICLRRA